MTNPDVKVAVYRLLAYLRECFRRGVPPDIADARAVVDVAPGYFNNVLRAACDEGLVSGVQWSSFQDYAEQVPMPSPGWAVTLKGVEYLDQNAMMHSAARSVAASFPQALASAVAATVARAAGL